MLEELHQKYNQLLDEKLELERQLQMEYRKQLIIYYYY